MKIFLLVVTILLFIYSIKDTPYMLSKNLYYKKMQETLDKQKELLKEQGEENKNVLKGTTIFFLLLLELFSIIYYILVGNRFSIDIVMLLLSAVQIVTVVITLKRKLNGKLFSCNIEDHKFYRVYFLFSI